jgi:hypothetical protein
MRVDHHRLMLVCGTVVALLFCSGCGSGGNAGSSVRESLRVDGVEFDGPWSEDFASLYRESKAAEMKDALRDGKISGVEYSYFEQRIKSCLRRLGVSAQFVDEQWVYNLPRGVRDEQVDRCLRDNGAEVMALRDAMEQNPENQDENQRMAKCLVDRRAAPPGYSARDYAHDLELGTYRFDLNSDGFAECATGARGEETR